MPPVLKIVDECFGAATGERRPALALRLATERITARELIRRRLADEVSVANRKRIKVAADHARTRSFLIPLRDDTPEGGIASFHAGSFRPHRFDEAIEYKRAIDAFGRNQFVLLVDERQICDLDEAIVVTPESEAVFLYLTPLIDG